MSFLTGNIVVQFWTVLDQNSNPLTGMVRAAGPGDGTGVDVQLWLHRQSGSAMVLASESITWTEIGTTGHYGLSFTPQNAGLYVLQIEQVDPLAIPTFYRFPDITVVSAGSVFLPAFTNAFCAESDVERWLQQPLTSSTKPSTTEAAGFAESRGAVLMSLCAGWGLTVTPATVENGSRLQDLLREANAIGAAFDCRASQAFGSGSARNTGSLDTFYKLWRDYVGTTEGGKKVEGYLQAEIGGNLVSLATDYILSGDTLTAPSSGPVTNAAIQVRTGDVY